MELALKAFLQTKGYDKDRLIKLGHDLAKILKKANALGLNSMCALGEDDVATVKWINSY